jgi:hypothetical protein
MKIRVNVFIEIIQSKNSHWEYGRISWGIHGLPKVSLMPAMPYHSTPCDREPLKRPYRHFRGDRRVGGLQLCYYPLGTPCHMGLTGN